MTTVALPAGTGTTPREDRAEATVRAFFAAYRAHDVEHMVDLCAEGAGFRYVPFEVRSRQRVLYGEGRVRTVGKVIWTTLIDAFPDLLVRVRRLFVTADNTAVAEITIDGTQADDFLAVANQEKQVDLDQAWMLTVTPDDRISAVIA